MLHIFREPFPKNTSRTVSETKTKNTQFQNTTALCNGLSDFHKFVLTEFQKSFDKNKSHKVCAEIMKNSTLNLLMEYLTKVFYLKSK